MEVIMALNGAGELRDGEDFSGAKLFSEKEGRGVQLQQAHLPNVIFIDASLKGANLSDANLSGARLNSADLQGSDLTDASLERADLTGAQLDEKHKNLHEINLFCAKIDSKYSRWVKEKEKQEKKRLPPETLLGRLLKWMGWESKWDPCLVD